MLFTTYYYNFFGKKGRDKRVELFEKPLSSKTVREIAHILGCR
jgi:hypothetical protein